MALLVSLTSTQVVLVDQPIALMGSIPVPSSIQQHWLSLRLVQSEAKGWTGGHNRNHTGLTLLLRTQR